MVAPPDKMSSSMFQADVYLFLDGDIKGPIENSEATFGPQLGEMGVLGQLRVANPTDACSPLIPPSNLYGSWIALISREQQKTGATCTFDQKVAYAASAGAVAAIIFDDRQEELVIMGKPDYLPDPPIPSVFISQHSGLVLLQALSYNANLMVRIMPNNSPFDWFAAVLSFLFVLITGGIITLTCVILKVITDRAQGFTTPPQPITAARVQEPPGLPSDILINLPIVVFQDKRRRVPQNADDDDDDDEEWGEKEPLLPSSAQEDCEDFGKGLEDGASGSDGSSDGWLPGVHSGETKRTCAICLEDYGEGEKLRRLPCNHMFHKTCVDQWFGGRKVCPVCRYPAASPCRRPTPEASDEFPQATTQTLSWIEWLQSFVPSSASSPTGNDITAPLLVPDGEEATATQAQREVVATPASVSSALPPLSFAARMRAARRGRRRRAIFASNAAGEAEEDEVDLEAGQSGDGGEQDGMENAPISNPVGAQGDAAV